jgi:uncharacterized protein (DUF488 family)
MLTIGYSGYQLDTFATALAENGVESLIDIREIPLSRKRGFSKSGLRDHLCSHGITYEHLRELGSPKSLRHEVRRTRDYAQFFRGMRRHLNSTEASEQLEHVVELARSQRLCMMCCCADWQRCHRRCVVDAILKVAHFRFLHLGADSHSDAARRAA